MAPSDLAGSILVKSFIAVKVGTYSKWLEPRNKSPEFAVTHLSLNSLVFISYMLIIFVLIYYMLDIVFVLTLVFKQESYNSTSTLSLEES